MKIFSIPLNPKLSESEFKKFYDLVEKYKDYIYDIYFTSRVPPFIQDAMGDVYDQEQALDLIRNSLVFQDVLGIPLSATFNNIEIPPTEEMLDLWIKSFQPLYDAGIKTVTLPHTIWMLSGKIQKAFPDLFVKNTILRNVQRPNELVKLVEAGFSYINLDRDLMRDHDRLLEIKRAKEYCIEKYGRDIKVSLLANEGCWGNCSVQDEHFQYNNTRLHGKYPTYFMTTLSKNTCTAWDRDDPGHQLKKADFPPWREDWIEFIEKLGIDVIKMHGREHIPRLFETMKIIENFANGETFLFDNFKEYAEDMAIEGSPINAWRKKIKTCRFECWDCNYCNQVVNAKSKVRYVDTVNNSVKNSSSLTELINNLVTLADARYLELGVGSGEIFSAALINNPHVAAVAVDKFSTTTAPKENEWVSAPSPLRAQLNKNIATTNHKNYAVLDKDTFEITQNDLSFKTSVLFSNNNHNQKEVISYYKDLCDEIFIVVAKNLNIEDIVENNLTIKHSAEFEDLNIYVLEK